MWGVVTKRFNPQAERKQEKLAVQRANRAAAAAQGGSLYGVDRHLVGAPQPYDTEYAPSTSQLTASGRPQRAAAAAYNGNLYLNNQPDIEYNLVRASPAHQLLSPSTSAFHSASRAPPLPYSFCSGFVRRNFRRRRGRERSGLDCLAPSTTHTSAVTHSHSPLTSFTILTDWDGRKQDLPRAKRTVKANSLYTSDDLLTGEDIKLPPPELLPDTGPVERRRPERTSAPAGTGRLSPKEAKEQAVAKDRGFRMDRLFNHCCSVLRNVESRNKNAWLFAEPVDGKIILDYHSVVTSPMDFATMKQKVEQKEYDSPLQFVTDARQVFTNCKLYNKPESAEAAMGLDVEHDFERRWMNSKIEEKWEQEMGRREQEEYDISVASDVRPPSPEPSAYAPATMSSMGSTLAKGGSAPKRSAYSHTSTQREMTFDEKRALSTALESLPPEKLGRVVEIIQEANALGDEDKEELELDIDLLEAGTLWKLQRFVASVNTAKVSAPAGDFSDIFAVADTLPQPSFGGSDSSSSSDEEE